MLRQVILRPLSCTTVAYRCRLSRGVAERCVLGCPRRLSTSTPAVPQESDFPPNGSSSAASSAVEDDCGCLGLEWDVANEHPDSGEYVLLAYKALAWGTVYSIAGMSLLTAFIMFCCGWRSVNDVLQSVREKSHRDMLLFESKGCEATGSAANEVKHFDLDFSQPMKAAAQLKEIWQLVLTES